MKNRKFTVVVLRILSCVLAVLLVLGVVPFKSLYVTENASAATVVDIPDAAFKKALNKAINPANAADKDVTKEELEQINFLNLSDSNINNLTGLSYCKGLNNLYISDTSITELPDLPNGLSLLCIERNNLLTDYSKLESAISNYTKLKHLKISYQNFVELPDISGATAITNLDLSRNSKLNDISVLSRLSCADKVTNLSLENCKSLHEITPLSTFSNLTELDLEKVMPDDTTISGYVSTISGLQTLEELLLSYCCLGKYANDIGTMFAPLTNLKLLELSENELENIDMVLSRKDTLTTLGLYGNKKLDNTILTSLKELKKLTVLSFGDTGITDYSFVKSMPDLTTRCIRHEEGTSSFPRKNSSFYSLAKPSEDGNYYINNPVKGFEGQVLVPDPSSLYTYDSDKNQIVIKGPNTSLTEIRFTYNADYPDGNTSYNTIVLQTEFPNRYYLISYDLKGGTVYSNPAFYAFGQELKLNNPTREGYAFTGWTGSNGMLPQMDPTIDTRTNRDLSFTASWEPVEYTILYDLVGGTISGNPASYDVTTDSFTLNNPTREHYTFLGWTGSNGTTPQTSVTIEKGSTGNKSYTANWKATEYPIHYDLNGGRYEDAPLSHSIESPEIIIKEPVKPGYEFVGWTGSCGDIPVKEVKIPAADTEEYSFIANWKIVDYAITYNTNGGEVSGNPSVYNTETEDISLTAPVKTGYEFTGWTGSNGTTPEKQVVIKKGSAGDKSYTANYKAISYPITYQYNGAKKLKNPTSYTIESNKLVLKNPKRKGYVFKGWRLNNEVVPVLNATIPSGSYGKRTYTAVWEPKLYKMPYLKAGKIITKNSKFKFAIAGVPKGYKVKWNNSNKKVISLSKKGTVTAKKNGKSTVGYRLYDANNLLVYGFQIQVKVITSNIKTLNTSSRIKTKRPTLVFDKSLHVKKKFPISFYNLEKDAKITYKSSNSKIVSVSKKGIVKAKKEGFALVTVTVKQAGITYDYKIHFKSEKGR